VPGIAFLAVVAALVTGLVLGRGGEEPAPPASAVLLPGGGGGGKSTVGKVYAAAGPAVVSVRAQRLGGTASGTGFVIDGDGTVVTNAHVIGDAERASVRFDDSGPQHAAKVRGTDPSSDLAVLEVDPGAIGSRRPLGLADSRGVKVGDSVVAIGHPFGLDRTATAGIVSGLEREIRAPDGFQIDEVIQTDAPINPGNSGGPLLDARGRVIGVNSQIATAGAQGNVGIGFAVPANTVRDVLPRLKAGESIERAYLGVTTGPATGPGAAVRAVEERGPADRAGIRTGGVIVAVEGRAVREPDDVSQAIADKEPGDLVRVVVERYGERRPVTVRLGKRPERLPTGP